MRSGSMKEEIAEWHEVREGIGCFLKLKQVCGSWVCVSLLHWLLMVTIFWASVLLMGLWPAVSESEGDTGRLMGVDFVVCASVVGGFVSRALNRVSGSLYKQVWKVQQSNFLNVQPWRIRTDKIAVLLNSLICMIFCCFFFYSRRADRLSSELKCERCWITRFRNLVPGTRRSWWYFDVIRWCWDSYEFFKTWHDWLLLSVSRGLWQAGLTNCFVPKPCCAASGNYRKISINNQVNERQSLYLW